MRSKQAFTLAELLISLGILGIIATFTIPKILSAQQNSTFIARAKDTIAMISGAYQVYSNQNTATANTTPGDLTLYMNYVVLDTSTVLDDVPGGTSFNCGGSGGTDLCLKLHNGGTVEYNTAAPFSGTASTNALYFTLIQIVNTVEDYRCREKHCFFPVFQWTCRNLGNGITKHYWRTVWRNNVFAKSF